MLRSPSLRSEDGRLEARGRPMWRRFGVGPMVRDAPLRGAPHHDGVGWARGGCALIHGLARIDAPQAFLLDPAVETLADDAAPVVAAALHGGEHARLYARRDLALLLGGHVQRHEIVDRLGGR